MKNVRVFDANRRPLKIGSYLAYTEDRNPDPVYDYADSLLVLTGFDKESIFIKNLIYNKAFRGHDFHPTDSDEIFSLSIFDVTETEDGIEVVLKYHYLMDNQSDPSVEDLEYQLKQIRGIAV